MRRLSWIIQVDPTCNHESLYKRKAEGDLMMVKIEEGATGQGIKVATTY